MKIFIVEDDDILKEELTDLLKNYGYETETSNNYQNIIQEILNVKVDLILLDVNLPYFDGFYICREIRKKSNVPIIIVTSRNSEMDEIMSMNLGADDYITKPYNTQILLGHIFAVLKRTKTENIPEEIEYKGIILNISSGILKYKNIELELTKNEFYILKLLMTNKGKIVSRDDMMNELWQSNEFIDDNTLTVNINRLRKRLEDNGIKDFIQTRRGQGYIV